MARNGQVLQNELYIRCPNCGDTKNSRTRAHFSVNLITGKAFCFRCGYGVVLSNNQLLELASHEKVQITGLEEASLTPSWPELSEGASTTRRSALERFHAIYDKKFWDAFESRDIYGHFQGLVLRRPHGQSKAFGEVHFGFVGEDFPSSDEDDPLYLNEGPYDVTDERDLCVFGLIRQQHLQHLSGHSVILVPDGDVWQKPHLLKGMIRLLEKTVSPGNNFRSKSRKKRTLLSASVVGVDFITTGEDPDSVPKGSPSRVEIRGRKDIQYLISYFHSNFA